MKRLLELAKEAGLFLAGLHPAKLVALGYAGYLAAGWALLSLPFTHRGAAVPAIDNLFIAMSALSTTGLTTVSVADSYTFWGQLVILILIQLGGIGYMTFGSFVLLSRGSHLTERRERVGQTVFALPQSFKIEKFIRSVIKFTMLIEMAGAAVLYAVFSERGVENPLWNAIFHSISAFCTAGFSLFNTSFEAFRDDFWLNATIGILSYLGAIGFIVCVDFWRRFRGKVESVTLTSKIILWSTFWWSLAGTVLLFVTEPSISQLPPSSRLMAALFQSMTAITTVGFNTIGMSAVAKGSLLLLIMMMIVGASPAGTGGGLKSTTFSAMWGLMKSAVRGTEEVEFWGKAVPLRRVRTAAASVGFYFTAFAVGSYLLELCESSDFVENVFEAASALGTVGLSMGITASLTPLGKLIIIALMYCGRLGPLTFGIALFAGNPVQAQASDDDLAV